MTLAVTTIDEIPTTNQGLLDLAFTKLHQQKAFGFDRYSGACQYRTFPTGDRDDVQDRDDMDCCAIGMLMPDDVAKVMYRYVFMACAADTLLTNVQSTINRLPTDMTTELVAWRNRMESFQPAFLNDIQQIHDEVAQLAAGERVAVFTEMLTAVGSSWNLDVSNLLALDWSWLELAESGNDDPEPEPEDEED